jgi:hypothetical protein
VRLNRAAFAAVSNRAGICGAIPALKTYFKAYVTSDTIRHIIETGDLTDLATNPVFSTRDFKAVPKKYRTLIPEYVKDYVPLNQFTAMFAAATLGRASGLIIFGPDKKPVRPPLPPCTPPFLARFMPSHETLTS